jgi:hypothetical protein
MADMHYIISGRDERNLDMTTLETRRIREDLIEMFEILKGIEDVKEEQFLTIGKSRVYEGS